MAHIYTGTAQNTRDNTYKYEYVQRNIGTRKQFPVKTFQLTGNEVQGKR